MQLKILIDVSRTNYEEALNILWVVLEQDVHANIEDKIDAYMVTKDWCRRLAEQGDDDHLLPQFKLLAQQYEQEFLRNQDEVETTMLQLRPDIYELTDNSTEWIREIAKNYYRSLRVVAEFFAERENTGFREILDARHIPALYEK